MNHRLITSSVCIVNHITGPDECYIISYTPLGRVDSKMVMWFPDGDKTDAKDMNGVRAIEAVKEYLQQKTR